MTDTKRNFSGHLPYSGQSENVNATDLILSAGNQLTNDGGPALW